MPKFQGRRRARSAIHPLTEVMLDLFESNRLEVELPCGLRALMLEKHSGPGVKGPSSSTQIDVLISILERGEHLETHCGSTHTSKWELDCTASKHILLG